MVQGLAQAKADGAQLLDVKSSVPDNVAALGLQSQTADCNRLQLWLANLTPTPTTVFVKSVTGQSDTLVSVNILGSTACCKPPSSLEGGITLGGFGVAMLTWE